MFLVVGIDFLVMFLVMFCFGLVIFRVGDVFGDAFLGVGFSLVCQVKLESMGSSH